MANDRKQDYLEADEFDDDFPDFESDDSDDLDFHERKSLKKEKSKVSS